MSRATGDREEAGVEEEGEAQEEDGDVTLVPSTSPPATRKPKSAAKKTSRGV